MADRTTGKAKKRAKKAPGRATRAVADVRPPDPESPAHLAAECARLRGQLEAAQAQIQAMEAQRKELLDRINWAIDSLTSLQDA